MPLPQNTKKEKLFTHTKVKKKLQFMHQAIKRMNKHGMNSRSLNIKDHLKPVSTQPPLPCLLSHSLSLTIISMCKGANKEVKYREHEDSKKEKLQFDDPFDASKNNNQ